MRSVRIHKVAVLLMRAPCQAGAKGDSQNSPLGGPYSLPGANDP